MFRSLLVQFWADEAGALIATEYLLLGSVVTVGGVSGMTTMRDAVNDEYKEFGNSIRETRRAYTPALPKSKQQRTAGSQYGTVGTYEPVDVSDAGAPGAPHVTFAAP